MNWGFFWYAAGVVYDVPRLQGELYRQDAIHWLNEILKDHAKSRLFVRLMERSPSKGLQLVKDALENKSGQVEIIKLQSQQNDRHNQKTLAVYQNLLRDVSYSIAFNVEVSTIHEKHFG